MDPSRGHDRFCVEPLGSGIPPNLRFEVADAHHLPFRKSSTSWSLSMRSTGCLTKTRLSARTLRHEVRWAAQLRLVPKGERKSLENVIEDTRLCSRWARYFRDFHDPYLHLTPEQYAELAEQNGLHVRRIHMEAKAWDFESRSAFFAFGLVTFVAWTQFLPESEKPAFVTDVLDRYRVGRGGSDLARKIPSSFIRWMSR